MSRRLPRDCATTLRRTALFPLDAVKDNGRSEEERPWTEPSSTASSGPIAISGRITALGRTITLEAGKETAEVLDDRVEAFSYRLT
jgi:hypothetical protein